MKVTRGYGLLEKLLANLRCRMANKLIQKCHRGGRVLDIGCGSHPFFLLHTNFFEKFGVDQIISQKDQKQYKRAKIQLKHFDINYSNRLPYKDNFFDAVMMLAVIEHLEEKQFKKILSEVFRVLKCGCSFIYTTPSATSDHLLVLMSKIGLVSRIEIAEHKKYYRQEEIKKHLEQTGFSTNHMKFGTFELKFNTWGVAQK